ncbi:hypothetical protein HAX54_006780 [Datura stramonium]|uniref:Uncharacterized protein n=1 Tax=Datura stramonium TaxID=4076 RepID=A0ABS8WWZ9_DATST|nr:hypothetical protein [Datura stramonium]
MGTRLALDPHNITAGINNHVLFPNRATHTNPDEVFSTALIHTRNDVTSKFLFQLSSIGIGECMDPFEVSSNASLKAASMMSEVGKRHFVSVKKLELPGTVTLFIMCFSNWWVN